MISVKASFEGELRRFSTERPLAFVELYEKIQFVFGLKESVLLQYLDDEGDNVTISCDFELEEAIRICESIVDEKRPANMLRIQVVRQIKTLPQQPVEAQAAEPAKINELKVQLKEQRVSLKQELKQKIQSERAQFKTRLQEKQREAKEQLKKVRQDGKHQNQDCKRQMKEQVQTLKQQLRAEKVEFRQRVQDVKKNFHAQHKTDVLKIKQQQQQLNALLKAQGQQADLSNWNEQEEIVSANDQKPESASESGEEASENPQLIPQVPESIQSHPDVNRDLFQDQESSKAAAKST